MKSWTPCRALESVVLMGSLCLFLRHGTIFTNAQNQQAEEIFRNGYFGPGSIPFSDFKENFCKFMRPRGWVYRDYSWIEDADIDLSYYPDDECEADIVGCQYSQSFSDSYVERHNYARGPNEKYYDMVESPVTVSHWAIRRRVWRPDDDHEKLFYDQYIENDKTAVKFFTLPESFCSRRTPDYAEAYVSSVTESKWVKMIEYGSGFIEVELCGCRYKLPDDSYEYTYYGQSPDDEYYEVRLWNFVRDYESDEWAIWGKA